MSETETSLEPAGSGARDGTDLASGVVEAEDGSASGLLAARVVVSGDLAWEEVPTFREHLLAMTATGRDVVADLTAVTYLSSLAVSALVAGIRDARIHGGRFRVDVAGGGIVQRVLSMCQIPFQVSG